MGVACNLELSPNLKVHLWEGGMKFQHVMRWKVFEMLHSSPHSLLIIHQINTREIDRVFANCHPHTKLLEKSAGENRKTNTRLCSFLALLARVSGIPTPAPRFDTASLEKCKTNATPNQLTSFTRIVFGIGSPNPSPPRTPDVC